MAKKSYTPKGFKSAKTHKYSPPKATPKGSVMGILSSAKEFGKQSGSPKAQMNRKKK